MPYLTNEETEAHEVKGLIKVTWVTGKTQLGNVPWVVQRNSTLAHGRRCSIYLEAFKEMITTIW